MDPRLLLTCFMLPTPQPPNKRQVNTSKEKLAWHPQDSPHSFGSHLIKVGSVLCFCPVCSQVTPAHVICQNDHEIRFLASRVPTEAKIHKRIKTSQETQPHQHNHERRPGHGGEGDSDCPESPLRSFNARSPWGPEVCEKTLGLPEVVVPAGKLGATEMGPPSGILIQGVLDTCNPRAGFPHCSSAR